MKTLENVFKEIVSKKKIDNLKSDEEVYNLCLAYGYQGTYSDFESESAFITKEK